MRLVLSRLLAALPLLLFASLGAFILIHLTPGDPAATLLPQGATTEQVEAMRTFLGLDRPLVTQYLDWIGKAVTGDFGQSFISQRPVADLISERIGVTLSMVSLTMVLTIPTALLLGTVAGAFENRLPDRVITALTSLGLAMPSFWVGLLLVLLFAVNLRWFPSTGYVDFMIDPLGWLRHMFLPALTPSVFGAAQLTRQLRGSMSDVLRSDYIRTTRAKGLPPSSIILRHGLKNAAMAVVTLTGLQLIALLGGAVIVESVFGLPGLGSLIINAVGQRDIPTIQAGVLVIAVLAVAINLLVDILYGLLNPRVRV